ncbi:hypothetical protein AUJ62_02800 [Candidatus Pacearchaeota archaeon CG1_02_32_21]|nr:MAG: hypothetical protein AUJ62_02800 [Candidatus Pacearchaeota archaeon CG1_02_32_21]
MTARKNKIAPASLIDIEQKVHDSLSKFNRWGNLIITRETSFRDLGLDSLKFMEMVFDIEKSLGISFSYGAIANSTNYGELIDGFEKEYGLMVFGSMN